MNQEITKRINDLKNDQLHGANWLSIQAINLLSLTIKSSRADTIADFLNELKMTTTTIIEARPNMISIANYTCQFLNKITNIAQNQRQLDYVKNTAQAMVNELIKFAQEATVKVTETGAKIITNQDVIITCSYSSTVCKAFIAAKQWGTEFRVIVAESRYKDNDYGEISARQLKQHKITTTLIRDKEINRYTKESNKALVGADTILANGSLINGTPSYKLAQAASSAKINFYSLGETAKIDVRNCYGKHPAAEPGFDIIPSNLITEFITETGRTRPKDIINYISRYQGNC